MFSHFSLHNDSHIKRENDDQIESAVLYKTSFFHNKPLKTKI